MKTIKILALSVLLSLSAFKTYAQKQTSAKPTIIFVHGLWADGTSFSNQIVALQAKGYPVISVQNPATSLADDVAATQRAITQAKSDVILVGHSWGGFVITQAGNNPKVKGLVFVAALVPDLGESLPTLSAKGPAITLGNYLEPLDGFVYLSKEGVKAVFAQDLNEREQNLIYATQTPAGPSVLSDKSGEPAWRTKPSWYILAKSDRSISPELERLMAKRANSKTTEIEASHVVMLSHPDEVLRIIEEAAMGSK